VGAAPGATTISPLMLAIIGGDPKGGSGPMSTSITRALDAVRPRPQKPIGVHFRRAISRRPTSRGARRSCGRTTRPCANRIGKEARAGPPMARDEISWQGGRITASLYVGLAPKTVARKIAATVKAPRRGALPRLQIFRRSAAA